MLNQSKRYDSPPTSYTLKKAALTPRIGRFSARVGGKNGNARQILAGKFMTVAAEMRSSPEMPAETVELH